MGRNVNVWITDWHATGGTRQVDMYEVELAVQWIDANGDFHERSGTVTFPQILAQVPGDWLREALLDLTLRAARKAWEID